MVMVTHDVGLKGFADRVVWLRDGRIQRIESTPKWKQDNTIAELEDNLKALK